MTDSLMVINNNTAELQRNLERIKNWIKGTPSANLNFHEMVECIVRFGGLNARYAEEYKKQGIEITVRNETEKHDIPMIFDEMKIARNNLEEMIQLRAGDDFFKDKAAKKFMEELLRTASLGEYDRPEVQICELKKRILTQLASVYFYIWETKQKEPEYVYDNVTELNALKADYELYKKKAGGDNENPQFSDSIEEMLDRIENNKIMNLCVEENQDIVGTKLFALKLQAYIMKRNFKEINAWIEQNMNTTPNFRQMIDSIIEYGKLVSKTDEYFRKTGYPMIDEKGRKATHYEIPVAVPEVKDAQQQLHTMMRLRGKHEFFRDEVAKNFIQELTYSAETADYDEPLDQAVAAAKKDAMCIAAGVYFYIWDTKQREPWYKYDNVSEWNDLNNKYALYKESVGIQEEVRYDDHIYQGPQFGEVLEAMINGIDKNYAFSEAKTNAEEDNIGSHK